ncbi:uncharacterized protein LOC121390940 [Gigantopelta aegis]|uniref:uncharacterized protein LOC121390940 n=1 Tax=Gigantopelta aegis TaxID=1735272 RepID=UPI001B88A0A3|nr:uncharacterized protein LOC121390940 [Gigantopelta aegis]
MSVIFMGVHKRREAMKKKQKRKVHVTPHRRVGTCKEDGIARITTRWKLEINGEEIDVAFSRDNYHVYIDGVPVEANAFPSDQEYDLDITFSLKGMKGHIYSDVEGPEMVNYLWVNNQLVAKEEMGNPEKSTKAKAKSSKGVTTPLKQYMKESRDHKLDLK